MKVRIMNTCSNENIFGKFFQIGFYSVHTALNTTGPYSFFNFCGVIQVINNNIFSWEDLVVRTSCLLPYSIHNSSFIFVTFFFFSRLFHLLQSEVNKLHFCPMSNLSRFYEKICFKGVGVNGHSCAINCIGRHTSSL